ncbi:MAG: pantoate--beta-alanine ligase [Bacteroidia bacterium]|nr:pantoate--beta-alanine ligase [Bacteroidia bacterium]MCX7763294.1 pantoate--beta-alanine ligase [Bacteroidia bacterium]MDW8058340.1 pantoate--beta-alanine ligase [Bacteroidia bacterium]
MEVIETRVQLRSWRGKIHGSVGFIPTMGALHEGHLSLVRRSLAENPWTIVSIFVNPRQFGPQEDYHRYPRTLETDLRLLQNLGVSAAFTPSVEEMYSPEDEVYVSLTRLGRLWCGSYRLGHFDGVALVLIKLFNLIMPTRAYFGEKDFQQVRVVEKLVEELFFPIEIVRVPTVREPDGLAMSSRNTYLSPSGRAQALALYKVLQYIQTLVPTTQLTADLIREGEAFLRERFPEVKLEYLAIVDEYSLQPIEHLRQSSNPRILIAAYVEGVRLIDNLPLSLPEESS